MYPRTFIDQLIELNARLEDQGCQRARRQSGRRDVGSEPDLVCAIGCSAHGGIEFRTPVSWRAVMDLPHPQRLTPHFISTDSDIGNRQIVHASLRSGYA